MLNENIELTQYPKEDEMLNNKVHVRQKNKFEDTYSV